MRPRRTLSATFPILCFSMLTVAGSSPAGAVLVPYEYTGHPWPEIVDNDPELDFPADIEEQYASGSFELDIALLPEKSLSGIQFSMDWRSCLGEAITRFQFTTGYRLFNFVAFPVGQSLFNFTTDYAGNLTSWAIALLDGPPDLVLHSRGGDSAGVGGDFHLANEQPGAWTVKVPEPEQLSCC